MSSKELIVGKVPSGLFIVCAKDENGIDGFLASWIQQISFDPLLVTMAIKPGRPVYDAVKAGKVFTVNVVGDHEKSYLRHFWSGYDPEKNPFNEIPHSFSLNGGVILEQGLGHFDCEIVDSKQPGDHELVIAKVIDGALLNSDAKPMTHIRKSALDY